MSNRNGKTAKQNKKRTFSLPNKICPNCQSSLDKCGDYSKNHKHHRYCKTCKYSNF